jgi:hypothetical protein
MAINIGDRVPGSKWIVTGILGEGAMGHVLEVLRTTTNTEKKRRPKRKSRT